MFDIVGIGTPCIDLNVNVDKLPDPNSYVPLRQHSWQGGGKVATGLVTAARLSAKCAFWGAVGDDLYGRFCVADFKKHHIDTSGLYLRHQQTTDLSIVLSDSATLSRSFIYHRGNAAPLQPYEMDIAVIRNSRFVYISSIGNAEEFALKVAKANGIEVFIDADSYTPMLRSYLSSLDIFVASEDVYNAFFDNQNYQKNCESILCKGPHVVIFTFGIRGCVGMSEDGFFQIPVFDVEVHDTVGAGDVFHGALIAGMLKGKPVEEAARLASAVAAIKCTCIGGRAGIPTLDVAVRFMETGQIDDKEIKERIAFYERGLEHV